MVAGTPLLIAVLDYMCLGREMPSYRSLGSLMFVTMGAIGYVMTDKEFHVNAYTWVWYHPCLPSIHAYHPSLHHPSLHHPTIDTYHPSIPIIA
jgi:hypothetical protein